MSVETSLYLLLLFISVTSAQDCAQPCSCPSAPPPCPVGTSLVLDGCGCCKVCARQLGEPCSLLEPCDHHKELYCDYGLLSDTYTGICMAQEGQSCDLGGVIYRSGESFQPSCKHHCVCMNGEIGCVPTCASEARLPSPDCPYPRRISIPGKCCEEWVCDEIPPDQNYESVMAASQIHPLPSSDPLSVFRSAPPYGLPLESPRDNCIVQTTDWSECSATCGMGVSSRITNDNQHCQLERQTRICMIRPCNSQQEREIKRGRKCVRTPKAQRFMRFELSGCSSTRLYRPKFCGVCVDNRCCTPHRTVTAQVEFQCPEGDAFVKKMMFIKTCACHHDCPSDNDIFMASNTRRMIGDYDNGM
ncbi:CCN family member 2b isoform X2 [Cheilinus undulatus]|uniref:CCN family member 2b isoform X2 n=1 Tax=Cheilinus undulatus TaxID=241271 RepID=UPI001BD5F1DF|nr:CCN family member 2b isoform X2 [Cheilinus undulatus]